MGQLVSTWTPWPLKGLANQKGLKMDNVMSTAAAYDVIAKEFYEWRKSKKRREFYEGFLVLPSFLKLLGDVKGKKILDIGCGPGLYASLLTQKGAVVHGMDISKELIGIAKKEAPTTELRPLQKYFLVTLNSFQGLGTY
jgi:2-polyprenyl-3-methyl-5-hydroxy-6-metoxy-1,4-benzoquinol methylase